MSEPPLRVLYIVSMFPCWSETFIVREVHEMIRHGADVRIVSLKAPSESMVQSDAAALLDRVIYPATTWRTLGAVALAIARRPVREVRDLAAIIGGLAAYRGATAKSLVVWWRTLGLERAVRAIAPSHIHAHFATYPSTAAWLLSRRLGVPFSFTAHAHDIFLEDHMLAEKLDTAAFAVAISRFNRSFMRDRVPGSREEAVRIVHCGVRMDEFAFEPEGRDARRILAVGRLDSIKGFAHLVEACAILSKRGIAYQCDIVGSGPLAAMLEGLVATHGLAQSVHFLGARKQEEVRALMRGAALFAMPSVVTGRGDRDGIPVVLMEAMASGTPVVSTQVSGIPELVEDGVTGLLAPPGDAAALADCLERMLADPGLRRRLAIAGRGRVELEFDAGIEARKLYDAIAAHG
jgi:colanic acid/amylovoran biosynthesis glycosyltransferase